MAAQISQIIGIAIIVINILPFLIKKPGYLFLTALISLIMLFLLAQQ